MELSWPVFHEQFNRFKKAVCEKPGSEFKSFREGLQEWEGYKEDVYREGRKRLDWQSWTAEDVQTGIPIVQRVIKAVEIEATANRIANNLVHWDSRYGPEGKSHKKLLEALHDTSRARAFATVLFRLYRDESPEAEGEAFGAFVKLAGRRYDLPAYLFFLKDWNRFMPISPRTFDRAFELLGIDVRTSNRCSWENYTQFNEAISAVQKALEEFAGLRDVRMIDAHSFCWLLVRKPRRKDT